MRLKSFEATNMAEALSLVKSTLGEDAIIVSTREDEANKSVRITAAIEEFNPEPDVEFGNGSWDDIEEHDDSFELDTDEDMFFEGFEDEDFISDTLDRPERSLTEDNEDVLETAEEDYFESLFAIDDEKPNDGGDVDFFNWEIEEDDEGELIEQGFIEPITEFLIRHNVPAKLSDRIISESSGSGSYKTTDALEAALSKLYNFKPLPSKRHTKPIILVGPPGAGKTLTTAKLATQAVLNDLTPAVISTDIVRAGGVDQLKGFTSLLGIDLLTASDPHALGECISMKKQADQIIIDTPGFSPFIEEDMKELATLLKVTDFDVILVMPAGGDAQEAADMARIFHLLGATLMLPTRMDISRRYGGILSAAYYGKMDIIGGSQTCAVADGLIDLNAHNLSKILLPNLYNKSSSNRKKR